MGTPHNHTLTVLRELRGHNRINFGVLVHCKLKYLGVLEGQHMNADGTLKQSCKMSRIWRIYPCKKNWKVGVKSLGEYKVLKNQVLFWVNLSNSYEMLSSNQDYMIECSDFVP